MYVLLHFFSPKGLLDLIYVLEHVRSICASLAQPIPSLLMLIFAFLGTPPVQYLLPGCHPKCLIICKLHTMKSLRGSHMSGMVQGD